MLWTAFFAVLHLIKRLNEVKEKVSSIKTQRRGSETTVPLWISRLAHAWGNGVVYDPKIEDADIPGLSLPTYTPPPEISC